MRESQNQVIYYDSNIWFFEKIIWKKKYLKLYSAVQHLKKLISLFHKDQPVKPRTILKAINTASLMARPTINPAAKPTTLKQKQSQLSGNSTNKQVKMNWAMFGFYYVFNYFKMWIINVLKPLAWKLRDFLTDLPIETSMH